MNKTILVVILSCAVLTGTAVAEVWVNAAGHAIEAELIDCSNGLVKFKTSAGKEFSMPLRGLSSDSQKAVLKSFPPQLKPTPKDNARRRIQQRLDRFKRRAEKKAGRKAERLKG